jgi:protein phosphatase 1 regulatory subunit 10
VPDDRLVAIRLIERAIYGDENTDVSAPLSLYCTFVDILSFGVQGGAQYSAHSLRDLDRNEGAAMHMHLFEETVDWSEPLREWNILVIDRERILMWRLAFHSP